MHLKAVTRVRLPWPASLIPFLSFRKANDLNKDGLAQIMKEIIFFTYRLLSLNSVSDLKSTI